MSKRGAGHGSYSRRQANRRRRHRGWMPTLREGERLEERRAEAAVKAPLSSAGYQDTPPLAPCPGCGAETTYTMCAECAGGLT